MSTKEEKIYIGLDIGTNSVGWAVTDQDYRIVKKGGKSLWGTRLFEQGETAAKRRAFRTTRRRMQRRKIRLQLLQELFRDEVEKTDKQFFTRISESMLCKDDRSDTSHHYSLFVDKNYTDKDYGREYPTIYHLRSDLLTTDRKFDIRLIYLACHHIIKNRGHFLKPGDLGTGGDGASVKNNFKIIKEFYDNNRDVYEDKGSFEFVIDYEKLDYDNLYNEFKDIESSSKRLECWQTLLGFNDNFSKNLMKFVSGNKVKPALLGLEGEESLVITMDDSELAKFTGDVGRLMMAIKDIYDWTICQSILKGTEYISEGMVLKYKQYKQDLSDLKKLYRTYLKDKYKEVFKNGKKSRISSLNSLNTEGRTKALKDISEELTNGPSDLKTDEAYLRLNKRDKSLWCMPLRSTENSVLPYQYNKNELLAILNNQAKYYPFLNEVSDGLTVKDKILMLLQFRVPYYVGPLYKKNNAKFAWIKRNAEGRIYPWNFKDMVDENESEQKFITNMTNKCTYISTEDVLPKCSLIYSEYMVLSIINKFKINDVPISVDFKESLFTLFKTQSTVTMNKIKKFIAKELHYSDADAKKLSVTEIDSKQMPSMSSYIDFSRILGHEIRYDERPMIEDIIKFITVSESSERIKMFVTEKFNDRLSEYQIDQISRLKYSKWGRLSGKLLDSDEVSYVSPETGELLSIIKIMHATNQNLMEILNNEEYKFTTIIDSLNPNKKIGKISLLDIEESSLSPIVKRSMNQTVKILAELKRILKREPDKVFVEVNREATDPKKVGKTIASRREQVEKLFSQSKLSETCVNLDVNLDNLKTKLGKKDEASFKRDKLYLYFTQLGRCMYSQQEIKIEKLFDDNEYDIDHIYPQSLIKDDSLANRVLVCKKYNQDKGKAYPLSDVGSINVAKMKPFWNELYNRGFISKEKLARLERNTPLTDDELIAFVNRQLVSTSQAEIGIINLLKKLYDGNRVFGIKAKIVHDFRNRFDLFKVRELNDCHHAQDAYLNVVAGNVVNSIYTSRHFTIGDSKDEKNTEKTFNYSKFFEFNTKNIWNVKESLASVKKYYYHHDILFTTRVAKTKGDFYDSNPIGKGGKSLYPRKDKGPLSDTNKYGGYNKATTSHFVLIKISGKKPKYKLVSIPLIISSKISLGKMTLDSYLTDLKYKNYTVINNMIRCGTIMKKGDCLFEVRGRNDNSKFCIRNHKQWYPDEWTINYYKTLSHIKWSDKKYKVDGHKKPQVLPDEDSYPVYLNESSKSKKIKCVSRADNMKLYDIITEQLKKSIYSMFSLSKQLETFVSSRELFEQLSLNDQAYVLLKLAHLFTCTDFILPYLSSLISDADKTQKLRYSTNLDESIEIVSESITGFYVTRKSIKV